MGRSVVFGVGLSVVLGSLGGCSNDASELEVGEVPVAWATAYCAMREGCYGAAVDPTYRANCVQMESRFYRDQEFQGVLGSIRTGRVHYDAEAAQECFEDLAGRGCASSLDRDLESCERAFQGTIETGGPCQLDVECAGIATCRFEAECPGRCRPLAPEGGACISSDECQSQLVCLGVRFDVESTEGECSYPPALGDNCDVNSRRCRQDLTCFDEDGDGLGECQSREEDMNKQVGDPCNSFECSPGLVCAYQGTSDRFAGRCSARVGSGATCHLADGEQCPASEYCYGAGFDGESQPGVCTPLPGEGDVCNVTDAWPCTPGLTCHVSEDSPDFTDEGECKPLRDLGDVCGGDEDCYSRFCDDSICTAYDFCRDSGF